MNIKSGHCTLYQLCLKRCLIKSLGLWYNNSPSPSMPLGLQVFQQYWEPAVPWEGDSSPEAAARAAPVTRRALSSHTPPATWGGKGDVSFSINWEKAYIITAASLPESLENTYIGWGGDKDLWQLHTRHKYYLDSTRLKFEKTRSFHLS